MTLGEVLSPVGGILRALAAFFGKAQAAPEKNLKSRIIMRGIVSELPSDVPLKIVDENGKHHRGVYALNVLIWNRGTRAIEPSDFLENAPLRLTLEKDAYVIMADSFSNDIQLTCATHRMDDQTVSISFDCINPDDFVNIVLFYGGNPMTGVHIQGRVRGQATGIDHEAEEVKASFGERMAAFFILLLTINMFVGFPVSTWLIYRDYGFSDLIKEPSPISSYISVPFGMSLVFWYMYIHSRIGMWLERRKYPRGYPLHSDFEPPLWENIKGMVKTTFRGTKQRLSTSMFDWAKPVIVRPKRTKRLSVDDWMR